MANATKATKAGKSAPAAPAVGSGTAAERVEVRSVQRTLTLGAIVSIIFFTVSGGPYGLEDLMGGSGAGMSLVLIVLIPLIWSAPIALMCAELSTTLPAQGGYYVWSKRSMGPFASFCQGWWAWLTTWVDMALYPVLFVEYLSFFVPALGQGAARKVVMVIVIWTFTALNLRGSSAVGGSSRILGVILLMPFLLMIGIGLVKGLTNGFPRNPFAPFKLQGQGTFASLTGGMFVVMWNYLGWEGVSTVAGEMKNPRRDYPRALLISIPLITIVYLLPTLVGLAYAGTSDIEWTSGAWSVVAKQVAGPWLGYFMSACGMASAIGLFTGLLMVNSRVPFVMGRDGYFPKPFMRTNKNSAPVVSLVVSAAIYSIVVLIFNDFEALAAVDVMLYSAVLTLEFASLLVLRKREPRLFRPFKIPGGWFGAIAVLVGPAAVIAVAISGQIADVGVWEAIGKAVILMATGPLLYPVARWWKRSRNLPDDPTLFDTGDLAEDTDVNAILETVETGGRHA
jgi:amino acid transporter